MSQKHSVSLPHYESAAITSTAKEASLPTSTRGSLGHRHQPATPTQQHRSQIININMFQGAAWISDTSMALQGQHRPQTSAWPPAAAWTMKVFPADFFQKMSHSSSWMSCSCSEAVQGGGAGPVRAPGLCSPPRSRASKCHSGPLCERRGSNALAAR